jgi:hypothetical protein
MSPNIPRAGWTSVFVIVLGDTSKATTAWGSISPKIKSSGPPSCSPLETQVELGSAEASLPLISHCTLPVCYSLDLKWSPKAQGAALGRWENL